MSAPVRPANVASGSPLLPWLIPLIAGVVVAASTTLWIAGGLGSVFAGLGWPARGWSLFLVVETFTKHGGMEGSWPGASATVILILWAVLLVGLLVPPTVWAVNRVLSRPSSAAPHRSMAKKQDIAFMAPAARRTEVQRLRPSLSKMKPAEIALRDVGFSLGVDQASGWLILASGEDSILALMAPRSGKTTALAIPLILSAPGPVLATSNKNDLWLATKTIREEQTGETVWVFDPQGIVREEQSWWWNILDGVDNIADAKRLAQHFVGTVEPEKKDIWGPSAARLLASLFIAANHANKPVSIVNQWLSAQTSRQPIDLLFEAGFPEAAAALEAGQRDAPETRSSVYFTALAATQCLDDPDITRWVTPGTATRTFDPGAFVVSRQTLLMMSKEAGGSAAPLVAALADRVLRAAAIESETRVPGLRLDPPLLALLDEAANVAPIGDLPEQYSHAGSRGIVLVTILQSYSQGKKVWGENGMDSLWSASTIKLIGSGIDDVGLAEKISKLVGDHDVATVSVSTAAGKRTTTTSLRQQRILSVSEVRALEKGTALVFASGTKPVLAKTQGWWLGEHAEAVTNAINRGEKTLVERNRRHAEKGRTATVGQR